MTHSSSPPGTSDETYRRIVELAHEAIWMIGPDGVITFANHRLAEMLGKRGEDLIGLSYLSLLEPSQHGEGIRRFEERRQGVQSISDLRFQRTDGTYLWALISSTPIYADSGEFAGILAMATDISERKLAEARLADANRSLEMLRGCHEALIRATDEATLLDDVCSVLTCSDDYERAWVEPNGSTVVASITLPLVFEGQPVGVLALQAGSEHRPTSEGRDLLVQLAEDLAFGIGSLRARAEQRRLHAQVREQASWLDQARDAIMVRDLAGSVTYWNLSAEKLYGWPASEVLGHPLPAGFYADTASVDTAVETVVSRGEWTGELQQGTRDGRTVIVHGQWTLLPGEAGPRGILCINTDVTSQKKLETQLLRNQRMESIGTMAGGIAHDLNNVLAPILMGVQLLAAGCQDPDDLATFDLLRLSAERGADMVRQLLSFARGVEVTRTAVEVGTVVREIGKLARETFDRRINVRLEIQPGLPPVAGDPTQLHQLLLNLCVNARDAMPDGGELLLAAEKVTLDEQFASCHPEARPGDYVILKVSDTGTGMSSEVLERIFDPFFTTKEVGQGTGLGLSTVQAISKSHGGFLNVYSEPGSGTAFKCFLPVAEFALAERAEPGGPGGRGQGELILLVDDEPAILAVTRQTLENHGYRVLTAGDGAEAVALFAAHSHEVRIVLTDMTMPVMDGYATIRAIQRLCPEMSFIATSGLGAHAGVTRAASLGVASFLTKPCTAEVLLRTVRECLG